MTRWKYRRSYQPGPFVLTGTAQPPAKRSAPSTAGLVEVLFAVAVAGRSATASRVAAAISTRRARALPMLSPFLVPRRGRLERGEGEMRLGRPQVYPPVGSVTRSELPDQAGQPSVGQDLAARLAARAVRHLVRFVRHTPEVVTAPRTRLPVPAVHGEVVADLGGEPVVSAAFLFEGLGQDVANCGQQRLAVRRRQRVQLRIGRKTGAME